MEHFVDEWQIFNTKLPAFHKTILSTVWRISIKTRVNAHLVPEMLRFFTFILQFFFIHQYQFSRLKTNRWIFSQASMCHAIRETFKILKITKTYLKIGKKMKL